MRPRLLDLFCGAGGAGMGYHLAGFDVFGVDIEPQPDYPFPMVEGDVLGPWLEAYLFDRNDWDAVHASPPCQAFTDLKSMWNARAHEDCLTPTRALLKRWGGLYAIENVPGAPMSGHVTLCGSSLGLGTVKYDRELRRHRHFECNFPVMVPPCAHQRATIGIYGDHARDRRRVDGGERGVDFPDSEKIALAKEALGMPWAKTWRGLSQAIPPAYTEHIGGYLMRALDVKAVA